MDAGDLIRKINAQATLSGFQTLLNRAHHNSPATYDSVLNTYLSTCVFSTPANNSPLGCGFYSGTSSCNVRYPSYEFMANVNKGLYGCGYKQCSSENITQLYSETASVSTIPGLSTISSILYTVSSQSICPKISVTTPFSQCNPNLV